MLASGSKESCEAVANSSSVVANSTSRAVSASLISISLKRILARRALLKVARRSAVSSIAQASHVLHGIPRCRVHSSRLGRQVLLGPASTTVIAVIRASGTLAGNSLISSKALAFSSGTIAGSLIRALHPGVKIVSIDNRSNPSIVLGACAK